MKASQQQQETLLDLGQIDLQIRRSRLALEALQNSAELDEVRAELMQLSEVLLSQRNTLDSLEIDLSRAAQDLELVDERIKKDKDRLEQSSNPRDIQGIQHELISLAKRKDTLEDAELVLMEKVESAKVDVAVVTQTREAVQHKLSSLEANMDAEVAKLKSGIVLLNEDRERAKANLSAELADHYEKLRDRGVGVGRFSGIACGVCGMTMTGAGLDEVRATPMDELAHCMECNGILVR
jgi:predicted  nucleic acid-binding Zn-ribbon protein